jgi:steroid 5-alpha reductase family enzyme
MSIWTLVGIGINAAILMMVVVWYIAKRLNNAGYVDAAWSYGFTFVIGVFALTGSGDTTRKLVLAAMVAVWSLRLGTHILLRLLKHHPAEDPRYAELREMFPKRPWFMFFGFFQLQAILIGILSIPFAISASNPAPALNPWEIAGVILFVVAFLGEIVADAQLAAFKRDPANAGKVCDAGLWRYSRHPNYFFEWLIWVAFFLYAIGSPHGWVGIISPLLMLLFLTKVTGIPPAEAQSLKSRGEAYRDYQRRTSAFVPWLPRT